MLPWQKLVLVIGVTWSCTAAIRVDWNTNKGPIVPAAPVRPTARPLPPYREPAPVWEDQSDDIPNPNPYKYVLPPPSRPKVDNSYYTSPSAGVANALQFGQLIYSTNQLNDDQRKSVAALSPQYIPNVGVHYVAVVPQATESPTGGTNSKSFSWVDRNNFGKQQAKYNPKTKKYKVYEKAKRTSYNDPFNYSESKTGVYRSNFLDWRLQRRYKRNATPFNDISEYILENEKQQLGPWEPVQSRRYTRSTQNYQMHILNSVDKEREARGTVAQ